VYSVFRESASASRAEDRVVEQKLIFDNLYPFAAILFIALGAFGLSVIAYAPAFRRWPNVWVALLIFLRTLAIVVLLGGLAGIALEKTTRTTERTSIAFLVDVSKSMSMEDGKEGASRLQTLKESLLANRVAYEILNRKCTVREYVFADRLRPLTTPLIDLITTEKQDDEEMLRASEPRTAVGDALDALTHLEEGKAPHVIVLMSDGASNAGADPIEEAILLGTLNVPVYAAGYGLSELSGASRDIAAVDINATKKVLEEGALVVEAQFAASGLAEEEVLFELEIEGKSVESKRIRVERDAELVEASFRHRPSAPGFQKVTVSAKVLPGELIDDNNAVSTYTEVISGKIPILYIEGRLRYEYTFLQRLLEGTEGFIVDERLVALGREGAIPERKDDWRRYKVVILGDVTADNFTKENLEGLAEAASSGVGCIMIGGLYNFSDARFIETPLGNVLPVFMAADAIQINEPVKMMPADVRPLPPMLRLSEGDDENLLAWRNMPPLDGVVTIEGPKRAARILARAARTEGEQPSLPVLVTQNYGKGRSAAFLADSTWRWVMEGAPYGDYYKRFWLETMLWLSGSDLPSKGNIQLVLDDYRIKRASRAEAQALVTDSEGVPMTDVSLHATLIDPEGELAALTPLKKGNGFLITWQAEKTGDYRLSLSATERGEQIDEIQAKFVSFAEDPELTRVPADFYTLEQVARKSGGEFYRFEKLGELFAMLAGEKSETRITVPVKIELWNSAYACIFFIALLSVEWLIRRRLGMA
jgi:uncharacterized membrane protein